MKEFKVKAKDTEIGRWKCPICGAENPEILIKDEELPEYLECPKCGHKSGKIDWLF